MQKAHAVSVNANRMMTLLNAPATKPAHEHQLCGAELHHTIPAHSACTQQQSDIGLAGLRQTPAILMNTVGDAPF